MVLLLFTSRLYSQSLFLEKINLYPSLINLVQNPDAFFSGFQYEMDNLNPIYGKKYLPFEWRSITERELDDIYETPLSYRFSFNFNPQALLYSLFSYSFKVTALREDVYIPQLYFGLGHYFYIPMYGGLVDDPYKSVLQDITTHTFSASVGVAKSLHKDFKLFGGYRFAYGFLSMSVPDSINTILVGLFDSSIKKSWFLHDLFFGVTFLLPNSSWEAIMMVEFNPQLIHFGSKLEFLYKYVGLGLGYYPNNVIFPFRPFVRVMFEF